ncbi:MAG: hypothetical protein AAF391_00180 [Bacteroidota bacterium]
MIEADFSRNAKEKKERKIQLSVNTLFKQIDKGNLRAGDYNRSLGKVKEYTKKLRDLCRKNAYFLQAETKAKFIVICFIVIMILAYAVEMIVFSQELRSLMDHWIVPVLIPLAYLAVGAFLNMAASDLKKKIDEADVKDANDQDVRSYRFLLAGKVAYVLLIVFYAWIATNQIYALTELENSSLADMSSTYGISEEELKVLEGMLGSDSQAQKNAESSARYTPFFLVFLIGSLHTCLMLFGNTVVSAFSFMMFKFQYMKGNIALARARSARDRYVDLVGQAFTAAAGQIRNLERFGQEHIPPTPHFSAAAEKVYALFEDGYDPQDPDILSEFLDGDEMAKYNVPLIMHPTAGYTGESLPEEENLPI